MVYFTDNDLKEITSILGAEQLNLDVVARLETAATEYLGAKIIEEGNLLPSNQEKQKQLTELINATENFEKALINLDAETLACINKDFSINTDINSLPLLQEAANRCKNELPSRGPLARRSRHMLLRNLMAIYEDVSSKKAARIHDPLCGLDTGEFLKFARAILLVIDPDARNGIEHVICDVLKE